MKKSVVLFFISFIAITSFAQQTKPNFTRQDTLRGSITPEREWWDLTYYHLDIQVFPELKTIKGKNTIQFKVLKKQRVLQVDLQAPLTITKVTYKNKEIPFKSEGNAHFITLPKAPKKDSLQEIVVFYEGAPREAVMAPWDGGISWKKDNNNNHFIASSCQGIGASVWWPNKDHMYDEVDSMDISVRVPSNLMNVSNGRLKKVEKHNDGTTTYHWHVNNPINNYGVNINIGDYVHFSEAFEGEKGTLDMDYYVLRYNLEKAKHQFKDAKRTLEAFEYWFGPYPFYEDGYKLVEVPYLGMEHQSSVTYGNQYKNGYLGRDLSNTGWGLKFDFIIVHETGHEWFANNITYIDIADMWIHESFTAYSETLFLDYHYSKEAASAYAKGVRAIIKNDRPIIGYYNVNHAGSGDMYYKGSNMLHTLRQLIEDDEKWRQILRGLNKTFYHKTVTGKQIEDYLSQQTGIDLTEFFNQYLRDTRIPTIEYKVQNQKLHFKYTNIVKGFDMPVRVLIDGKPSWIYPNANWKSVALPSSDSSIVFDEDFYVNHKKVD